MKFPFSVRVLEPMVLGDSMTKCYCTAAESGVHCPRFLPSPQDEILVQKLKCLLLADC